jgi:hypothetical protein
MWSGASVAHMLLVLEDLGLITTQDGIFRKLLSPFFQTTDVKTIKLCDVMLQPIKINYSSRTFSKNQQLSSDLIVLVNETRITLICRYLKQLPIIYLAVIIIDLILINYVSSDYEAT